MSLGRTWTSGRVVSFTVPVHRDRVRRSRSTFESFAWGAASAKERVNFSAALAIFTVKTTPEWVSACGRKSA